MANIRGTILAQWDFLEYEKPERSKQWFLFLGIATALLMVFALATANYVFMIIIALFVWIFFMNYNKDPMTLVFTMTTLGVAIEDDFISYRDLKYFWFAYDPPRVKKLYFRKESMLTPVFSVSLEDIDPVALRDVLLPYLEENIDEDDEPIENGIARILRL